MQRSEINAIPLDGDVSFRERAVEPERTALLVIDLQKGEYNPDKIAAEPDHAYLFERIRDVVIPNGQKLLAACRAAGVEVIYTVVESLTLDGRDRSLDYKVSGIFFPKGSWEAEVLDELQPLPNEIVIPKTSSSLFNSTNFEYVLRNLGIEYVMVMGIVTDQCVETAVRDGCDRGFLMTLIDDACATFAEQRHKEALKGFKGYCRIRSTDADPRRARKARPASRRSPERRNRGEQRDEDETDRERRWRSLLPGAAQAADDEVVIGFAVAESGWMNAYDGPPLKGAMLAIEEFNAEGGILGMPIRAVVADTKTDTVQGARAAAEVIAEGAQFMAVSCDYDMGAPAATVANDNGIIAISFCASDAKMGVQGIGPYAFTMEIFGQGEGAVGAEYAWDQGWRKAYALLDASIEYDKSICHGFLEHWKKLGGEVVGVDTFMQEDASIASQITRYKQAAAEKGEPEVMMLCSYIPGAVSAIRQMRAAGIDVPLVGGDSMDGHYWVEGVPGLSDHYAVTFGSMYGDDPRPEVNDFFERYRAKYGEPETSFPLNGYSVVAGHQDRGRAGRQPRERRGARRAQQVRQGAAALGRDDLHRGNAHRPRPSDGDHPDPGRQGQLRRPAHGRGPAEAAADLPGLHSRPLQVIG